MKNFNGEICNAVQTLQQRPLVLCTLPDNVIVITDCNGCFSAKTTV